MGALVFSHFRVTNVRLINEKNYLIITVSKWHDCVILLRFLYLACFVVGTYVVFIWVYWILMAYASSITYLLTRLQKTSVAVSERKNDHMQVYIIIMIGKQNFFVWNDLIVDRLTGPTPRLVTVYRLSCKFNNNLRT